MPMTNADFAKFAARIAKRAAEWAGDSLDLQEYRDKPIRQGDADRFIKAQRELLDYIERETRDAL
ncbi:hypothetical protein [Bradyrhizobium icense]|uniref:Uncharacterized protein n=1 Tax=Bradyrhizobium icense TaxID=1274631 RepID=A0A1B1UD65_9BRAD|nr:hypothetical protein [Bradyrhizobium icense]ANW00704.1 hypothetical protein LMTR13_11500 [Bradyrhizobium icense]